MGDTTGADHLYEEAQDQLTAKEMRSYAWLEVQRGFLDFAHGNHDAARSHYRRAEAAYSGYWLVAEHIAELLAAGGDYGQAIAILEPIVANVRRPEIDQVIGELYDLSGCAGIALQWKQSALSGYLESAECGEVHYYHHLVDFYADVAEDGSVAIERAGRDLRIRENFATHTALAWAFYVDGPAGEAVHWIERALAAGAVSALLFYRAGAVYNRLGSGQTDPSTGLSARSKVSEVDQDGSTRNRHHRDDWPTPA